MKERMRYREETIQSLIMLAKLLAGGLAAAIIIGWFLHAMPALAKDRTERKKLSPLIKEAKALDITYKDVLTHPGQAIGKPAIWCIQNRGENGIFYEGVGSMKIRVDPKDGMPLFLGSKHTSCTDMLVIVSSVTSGSFPGSGADFVTVRYIRQL